jgi:phage terminase large subunit-like protein
VQVNKQKSKQKIDGMGALIIALSRVIAGAAIGSVYNACAKVGGEASIIRSL